MKRLLSLAFVGMVFVSGAAFASDNGGQADRFNEAQGASSVIGQ
jgi:hypothetical protein